jgi:hypothetical protein
VGETEGGGEKGEEMRGWGWRERGQRRRGRHLDVNMWIPPLILDELESEEIMAAGEMTQEPFERATEDTAPWAAEVVPDLGLALLAFIVCVMHVQLHR